MTPVSRRSLLRSAGLSAAGLALSGAPRALAGPPEDLGLGLDSTVDASLIPSARTIHKQVEKMTSFGPRLTGSPEHKAWIDYLEQGLTKAGVRKMIARLHEELGAYEGALEVEGEPVP